jgi:hypothetical protein
MLRKLVMDVRSSLSLNPLSLLCHFANVLYLWALCLLLKTFLQERSDIVTLCNELLYIIIFAFYTVCMTLFDAT